MPDPIHIHRPGIPLLGQRRVVAIFVAELPEGVTEEQFVPALPTMFSYTAYLGQFARGSRFSAIPATVADKLLRGDLESLSL